MTPWEGMNRRKFPRINYPCMVVIRHEDETLDKVLTHTQNIGSGGICVGLKKGLKMLSPVDIEVDLMDFSDHIKCRGKVVWSVRRADPHMQSFYDTGIEFSDIVENDLQRLNGILARVHKYGLKTPAR